MESEIDELRRLEDRNLKLFGTRTWNSTRFWISWQNSVTS